VVVTYLAVWGEGGRGVMAGKYLLGRECRHMVGPDKLHGLVSGLHLLVWIELQR
jgi:hypothetical protein